jgi:hypothetical protein
MAVSTLVVTAGAANANAYVTRAFADQYHEDQPGSTWADLSADQRDAAILRATMLMDSEWIWYGYPTDTVQALQWPRSDMLKPNGREYVDSHTIPIELQRATAEYAAELLVEQSDIEAMGITSLKAGPVALTFKESLSIVEETPNAVVLLIPESWGYVRGRTTGVRELIRA